MKRPTVIVTDPNKIREICLNQPKVSREEAVASILAQNGKLPSSMPEKAKRDTTEQADSDLRPD